MASSSGSRPTFDVHSLVTVLVPTEGITVHTPEADYPRLAAVWIQYIVHLQDDLESAVTGVTGTLTDAHKRYYREVYAAELAKYLKYLSPS
eukprot:7207352-Pyramimonas_sp.AAC.1